MRLTDFNGAKEAATPPTEPASAPLMYWGLILVAAMGLVPSVLLPEWRQYERLRIAEQYEEHRLEQADQRVDREKIMLEAVRTDPAVIYRIARRELGIHPGESQTVNIVPIAGSAARESRFVPTAIEPPPLVSRAAKLLPAMNYDAVFCDGPTRRLLICLSVGLICVALALYGRARRLQS